MQGPDHIHRVQVHRLGRVFGPTWALRDVSARFEPGALNLIVGANGSGKSTLLGVIGTLIRPSSGTVQYSPDRSVDRTRAQIGWGSHEALLYVDLSARENVLFTARIHGLDPQAAWAKASDRFGLERFGARAVRVLSRGQRQRVALARVLLHGPSLVLLDEPTAGLDKEGVDRLREVLRDELSRGAVIVLVTHEPELFAALPQRLLRLDRGRVAEAQA